MNPKIGELARWRGRKVLVTDVHGYPVTTVDLRWTISGQPGGVDEKFATARNIPVTDLTAWSSP